VAERKRHGPHCRRAVSKTGRALIVERSFLRLQDRSCFNDRDINYTPTARPTA
jgi:hypothetical protein